MNTKSLIIRNDAGLSVSFSPEAEALKSAALESAGLIGRVANSEDQQKAVDAQKALATILKLVEDSRTQAKAPVLDYGRAIDAAAKGFVAELREEDLRIARLVGDFQALEMEKVRRAQQAENERLSKLEREKAAELAKATTHEQLDAVQQKFDERAKTEAPAPVAPTRVTGQAIREVWDITVTNPNLLAAKHPQCVNIMPKLREITALLDAGIKVEGINAVKRTAASVRISTSKALTI